jgi:NAD+ kinase
MSEAGVLRRVGVVGEGDAARVAAAAAERGGLVTVAGGARAMAGESSVDAVVAVGEDALTALVRHGVREPVLPVGPVAGVDAVPSSAVERGIGSLLAGEFERVRHPVLGASAPLDDVRALFDVLLVTEETARISEYTVRTGDRRVARFRADGVVVATPAGSPDYARAAGGPVVDPETGVVTVVPVAPFATDTDHWVLDEAGVVLRVERDRAPVELRADGHGRGRVPPGEDLRLGPVDSLTALRVPEGRSPFGG